MAMDQVQWTSPSPLWPQAASTTDVNLRRNALRQPVILRFATDTFRDDLLRLLETNPALLKNVVAKPETWRGPTAGLPSIKPVPAFARKFHRLGLIAARQKEQSLAVTNTAGQGASLIVGAQPGT